MVWEDLQAGRLERVLTDWSPPPIALHLVTPPGEPRPARVTALIAFLAQRLAAAHWADHQSPQANRTAEELGLGDRSRVRQRL
jgi:hypothetical protein